MAVPIWANRLLAEPELFNALLEDVEAWTKLDILGLRDDLKRGDFNKALIKEGVTEGVEFIKNKLLNYQQEYREERESEVKYNAK
jgi:hypothetical protein